MTILLATESLIEWFSSNDSFSISFAPRMKDDFSLLFSDLPDDHKNKSAVLLALEGLKENGIVKLNEASDQKCYVLCRQLSSLVQNVSLDFVTCAHLAKILNDVSKTSGYASDPQNITFVDVQNLIGLTIALSEASNAPNLFKGGSDNGTFSKN